MATLVLTAVGTALGGPLGGALGSLAGRALDTRIFGTPNAQGARLKELAVTTSSYGSYIPRLFGKVRTAGSIIWATDLVEHEEQNGGGKGKPNVTSYSYSISCAVALSSRPILGVGRIWADGNLLRGASGTLKVGGALRIYNGAENQQPDPLLTSDMGSNCPAFRGISYVVFEALQLADFGNRIPAFTFEVFSDDGEISLSSMLGENDMLGEKDFSAQKIAFAEVNGLIQDGGTDGDLISLLSNFYPLKCQSVQGRLEISDATPSTNSAVIVLPPPAASRSGEFATITGQRVSRDASRQTDGIGLRYYDIDRDYQPGLQRSRGKSGLGQVETLEFPATLKADDARSLAEKVARNRQSSQETMSYRIAVIDPAITCGSLVRPAGERGIWQVLGWEWRAEGVELELAALSPVRTQGLVVSGDAGQVAAQEDLEVGPSVLSAFELPWDGTGSGADRRCFAAVSSLKDGWAGAALYADTGNGALHLAGYARRPRATMGHALGNLTASTPHLFDRQCSVVVELLDDRFALDQADMRALSQGANKALLGKEIIQFANAEAMGQGKWRLSGLLRGRAGTEQEIVGHSAGESFVLLDEALSELDVSSLSISHGLIISALGNGDLDPVVTPVSGLGSSLRPLAPVKGRICANEDGSKSICWVRRARGAWHWLNEVDVPIGENVEAYDIRFVAGDGHTIFWTTTAPALTIESSRWTEMSAHASPRKLEIRQIGDALLSEPLTLTL